MNPTRRRQWSSFFFFNDTATTEIYTLSLPDPLPISSRSGRCGPRRPARRAPPAPGRVFVDRKSTRLNSSHGYISYAVFCLENHLIKGTHLLIPLDWNSAHSASRATHHT